MHNRNSVFCLTDIGKHGFKQIDITSSQERPEKSNNIHKMPIYNVHTHRQERMHP